MTDAQTITLALHGRWCGNYGSALCPAHDNRRTPALSLANGHDGKLLAKCFAGCSFIDIIEALRGLGILGLNGQNHTPNPAVIARHHEVDKAERLRRIAQAKHIWDESLQVSGSLAETYLRGRAITIAAPDTLRFHSRCWHSPSARRHPALVGKVERQGKLVGVMRTYLGLDSVKARIEKPKMALGSCAGGAVRLARPKAGHLCIGEGIETCLSAMVLGLGPAWACLSTSGLKSVQLPDEVRRVTVLADADEEGLAAALETQRRLSLSGRRVTIAEPVGRNDFNDLLGTQS